MSSGSVWPVAQVASVNSKTRKNLNIKNLSALVFGLAACSQVSEAQAQLIEKCGALIGDSLQASNSNLVVERGDQFIFDRPGFGISRENMRLSVRWTSADPWVPCTADGESFDCPGHFRIGSGHAEPLDGAGPGGYGGLDIISRNNVSVYSEYVSGSLLQCEVTGPPVREESNYAGDVPQWKVPVSLGWTAVFQTGLRNGQDPKIQYQIRFEFSGNTIPFREKAVF
jgi:hypothetical protein